MSRPPEVTGLGRWLSTLTARLHSTLAAHPLAAIVTAGLVVVAPPAHRWMDRYVYGDVGVFISLVNTGLFIAATVIMATELLWPRGHGPSVVANEALPAGRPAPATSRP